MNATHAIEAIGLTKRFRALNALAGFNLSVPAGSLCGLLGPNGSGKTTALRVLLGMLRPDSGEARVLGRPVNSLSADAFQEIGYVAEGTDYPAWMTGAQLFAWCRDTYPDWDADFCRRLVSDFEIPLDNRLDRCSRGQRMKILLISSIAFRPKLLVLDEPFSGLDPVHREEFGEALLEIAEVGEWSMIVSSHDVDDIERLIDRVAIIRSGKLMLEEDTESLRKRFRRIEARAAEGPDDELRPEIPPHWRRFQKEGRRISFIDSDFDPGRCERDLVRILGEDVSLEAFGMNLREIYIALAKNWKGPRS